MSKANNLLKFKPAELHEGIENYVSYYVEEPGTEKMIRKRIKLNHIKSPVERRKYAKVLIQEINSKLYSGWNPFLAESVSNGYNLLTKAVSVFLTAKNKELREDSLRSYNSFLKTFVQWLDDNGKKEVFCVNFTAGDANKFMSDLYAKPTISGKTWNNYLTFFRSFWNWMIEHQYVVNNVFAGFAKKQQTPKNRSEVPGDYRERIREHLEVHDYNFMIVSMLVFHCLLRPREVAHLKPSNFLLKEQIIRIPAHVSKNKTERLATIPDAMMPYLVQWDFNSATNDQYIFGKDFVAGTIPVNSRRFSKKWVQLRKQLNLPKTMKLYSLRDSGIMQLLNDGISPDEVMIHADHSSLEITSIYVKHAKPKGSEVIKRNASEF